MSKKAVVILTEGFEDMEAVVPIDIMTRAGIEVTIASPGEGPVRAAYGTTIMPTTTIDRVTDLYDAIVFPGGGRNAQSLAADRRVVDIARRHYGAGELVAAICASSGCVLAEAAEILKGKRATGDPGFNDKLAAGGAIITDELVTIDGNIITGMGPGAAMLFGLQIAEYLCGKEAAEVLARRWRVER